MLRYLLPSVVEISGAKKKTAQLLSIRKDYQLKIKQKSIIVLRYLLPSVVEISGAGIKRTVVIN